MSRWRPFAVALALPVLFTALVLVSVLRNRGGGRDEMELTQREIALSAGTDDNSGVTAWLVWSPESEPGRRWLSPDKLESLGFELTADRSDVSGPRDSRQLQRRAYVALELRDVDRSARASRLVPVDASIDRDELLARYPNGRTHVVTAGIIGIRRDQGPAGPFANGYLVNIDPRGIHVPTRFAGRLRRGTSRAETFTVSVRYGSQLEPWIVDVR